MSTFVLQGVRINDPHVAAVIYVVSADGSTKYENAIPLETQNSKGRFLIKDDRLRIEPAEHFATQQEAIEYFGPYLRAWEAHAGLQSRLPGVIRFRFESTEIIDRSPLPLDPSNPAPVRLQFRVAISIKGDIGFITPSQTLHAYPPPPTDFKCSPEFDMALARWWHYRSGLEPLQGASYFVLKCLEESANATKNRRRTAAATYAIDFEVLKKVGELVSERGDARSARKYVRTDLTDDERNWLVEATLAMIRRLAERAAGAGLTQITMRDLPPLP